MIRGEHIINAHTNPDESSINQVTNLASHIIQITKKVLEKPVYYRLSDNKNNNHNFRGVSRFIYHPKALDIEAQAFYFAKTKNNLSNLHLLLPYVRDQHELVAIKKLLSKYDIKRAKNLKIATMIETPSSVYNTEEIIDAGIDQIVIGLNDLIALSFGMDRSDPALAVLYNDKHPAIHKQIRHVIDIAKSKDVPVFIAGESIEIHPDTIENCILWGISGFSVSIAHLPLIKQYVQQAERKMIK